MIFITSLILIAIVYKMSGLTYKTKMMIIGMIILASGVGIMFLIPFTTRAIAREWMIKLRRGSTSFKPWAESRGHNLVKYYLFNLTNPVEFVNGAKARFEEVGPFAYDVRAIKDDIVFHGKNRVSYTNRKVNFPVIKPNIGLDPDEHLVTTINAPLVFAMSMINKIESAMETEAIKSRSPFTKSMYRSIKNKLNGFLKSYFKGDNSLLIVRTANEILFNGRPDPLLSLLPLIVDDSMVRKLNGSFSWNGFNNGTKTNRVTVFTGRHNFDRLNSIDRLNGKHLSEISHFKNKCDKNGKRKDEATDNADANLNIKNKNVDRRGRIFSFGGDAKNDGDDEDKKDKNGDNEFDTYQDVNEDAFLFGNVDHDHVQSIKYIPKHGCKIFKYKLIDDDYDCDVHDYKTDCKLFKPDYDYNLDNHNCYSNHDLTVHGQKIVLPNGIIDTSSCFDGLPLAYSEPHFYHSSDVYEDIADGLNPVRDRHEGWITIDPVCGGVIQRKIVGQLNVLIDQSTFNLNQKINNFTNHVLYPVFWWEADLKISRKSMKDIWLMKELSQIIGYSVGAIISAFGFFIMVLFATKS